MCRIVSNIYYYYKQNMCKIKFLTTSSNYLYNFLIEIPTYIGEDNTYVMDFDLDGDYDEDCAMRIYGE